jgi:hypothetical protein
VIQQLAAGSYNIAPSAGLVDPIRAIEKGAPLALVRILLQAPPYALIIALAARHRLPAIYGLRSSAAVGGLISYGYDDEVAK